MQGRQLKERPDVFFDRPVDQDALVKTCPSMDHPMADGLRLVLLFERSQLLQRGQRKPGGPFLLPAGLSDSVRGVEAEF